MSELDNIIARTKGHAPGPWEAGPLLCWTTNKPAGRYDAWVFGDDVLAEETDAKLIAAAPDLLRIATEQREQIRELREALMDMLSDWADPVTAAPDHARAVLDKHREEQ